MEEKQKKPIYKRVWFWIVIVFIAIQIGEKAINLVSDATSKPGQPMINEEHMAEQARIYEELQKEEQEALEAIESGEMIYTDLTDRVLASVESLVSDTFRGEHYSCTV